MVILYVYVWRRYFYQWVINLEGLKKAGRQSNFFNFKEGIDQHLHHAHKKIMQLFKTLEYLNYHFKIIITFLMILGGLK